MIVSYRLRVIHAILHCCLSSRFDFASLNHTLKYPGFRNPGLATFLPEISFFSTALLSLQSLGFSRDLSYEQGFKAAG